MDEALRGGLPDREYAKQLLKRIREQYRKGDSTYRDSDFQLRTLLKPFGLNEAQTNSIVSNTLGTSYNVDTLTTGREGGLLNTLGAYVPVAPVDYLSQVAKGVPEQFGNFGPQVEKSLASIGLSMTEPDPDPDYMTQRQPELDRTSDSRILQNTLSLLPGTPNNADAFRESARNIENYISTNFDTLKNKLQSFGGMVQSWAEENIPTFELPGYDPESAQLAQERQERRDNLADPQFRRQQLQQIFDRASKEIEANPLPFSQTAFERGAASLGGSMPSYMTMALAPFDPIKLPTILLSNAVAGRMVAGEAVEGIAQDDVWLEMSQNMTDAQKQEALSYINPIVNFEAYNTRTATELAAAGADALSMLPIGGLPTRLGLDLMGGGASELIDFDLAGRARRRGLRAYAQKMNLPIKDDPRLQLVNRGDYAKAYPAQAQEAFQTGIVMSGAASTPTTLVDSLFTNYRNRQPQDNQNPNQNPGQIQALTNTVLNKLKTLNKKNPEQVQSYLENPITEDVVRNIQAKSDAGQALSKDEIEVAKRHNEIDTPILEAPESTPTDTATDALAEGVAREEEYYQRLQENAARSQDSVPDTTTDLFENRDKDTFEDSTDFGGKYKEPLKIVPESYAEANGIGVATYVNPNTGIEDVYLAGFGGKDFIGFMRQYDKDGNPTNTFTSKLERRTDRAGATRQMMESLLKRLPDGHRITENVSVSTDGLTFFISQLEKGYTVAMDNGKPVTSRVAINGESKKNILGDVDLGNGFANIKVTADQFANVKDKLGQLLERYNVGLNSNNVYRRGSSVFIDLPVLEANTVRSQERTPDDSNSRILQSAGRQPSLPGLEEAPPTPQDPRFEPLTFTTDRERSKVEQQALQDREARMKQEEEQKTLSQFYEDISEDSLFSTFDQTEETDLGTIQTPRDEYESAVAYEDAIQRQTQQLEDIRKLQQDTKTVQKAREAAEKRQEALIKADQRIAARDLAAEDKQRIQEKLAADKLANQQRLAEIADVQRGLEQRVKEAKATQVTGRQAERARQEELLSSMEEEVDTKIAEGVLTPREATIAQEEQARAEDDRILQEIDRMEADERSQAQAQEDLAVEQVADQENRKRFDRLLVNLSDMQTQRDTEQRVQTIFGDLETSERSTVAGGATINPNTPRGAQILKQRELEVLRDAMVAEFPGVSQVDVVETVEQAREMLPEGTPLADDTEGFAFRDAEGNPRIVLVGNNIENKQVIEGQTGNALENAVRDGVRIFFHESLGHDGLRQAFGDNEAARDNFTARLYEARRDEINDWGRRRYSASDWSSMSDSIKAEEWLVQNFAEEGIAPSGILDSIRVLFGSEFNDASIRKQMNAIQTALRKGRKPKFTLRTPQGARANVGEEIPVDEMEIEIPGQDGQPTSEAAPQEQAQGSAPAPVQPDPSLDTLFRSVYEKGITPPSKSMVSARKNKFFMEFPFLKDAALNSVDVDLIQARIKAAQDEINLLLDPVNLEMINNPATRRARKLTAAQKNRVRGYLAEIQALQGILGSAQVAPPVASTESAPEAAPVEETIESTPTDVQPITEETPEEVEGAGPAIRMSAGRQFSEKGPEETQEVVGYYRNSSGRLPKVQTLQSLGIDKKVADDVIDKGAVVIRWDRLKAGEEQFGQELWGGQSFPLLDLMQQNNIAGASANIALGAVVNSAVENKTPYVIVESMDESGIDGNPATLPAYVNMLEERIADLDPADQEQVMREINTRFSDQVASAIFQTALDKPVNAQRMNVRSPFRLDKPIDEKTLFAGLIKKLKDNNVEKKTLIDAVTKARESDFAKSLQGEPTAKADQLFDALTKDYSLGGLLSPTESNAMQYLIDTRIADMNRAAEVGRKAQSNLQPLVDVLPKENSTVEEMMSSLNDAVTFLDEATFGDRAGAVLKLVPQTLADKLGLPSVTSLKKEIQERTDLPEGGAIQLIQLPFPKNEKGFDFSEGQPNLKKAQEAAKKRIITTGSELNIPSHPAYTHFMRGKFLGRFDKVLPKDTLMTDRERARGNAATPKYSDKLVSDPTSQNIVRSNVGGTGALVSPTQELLVDYTNNKNWTESTNKTNRRAFNKHLRLAQNTQVLPSVFELNQNEIDNSRIFSIGPTDNLEQKTSAGKETVRPAVRVAVVKDTPQSLRVKGISTLERDSGSLPTVAGLLKAVDVLGEERQANPEVQLTAKDLIGEDNNAQFKQLGYKQIGVEPLDTSGMVNSEKRALKRILEKQGLDLTTPVKDGSTMNIAGEDFYLPPVNVYQWTGDETNGTDPSTYYDNFVRNVGLGIRGPLGSSNGGTSRSSAARQERDDQSTQGVRQRPQGEQDSQRPPTDQESVSEASGTTGEGSDTPADLRFSSGRLSKDLYTGQGAGNVTAEKADYADAAEQVIEAYGNKEQKRQLRKSDGRASSLSGYGDGGRRSAGRVTKALEGTPSTKGPNGTRVQGPIQELVDVAEKYAAANGINYKRQAQYVEVDEELAGRIADAYAEMEHTPNDPAVKAAYRDLIDQTRAQYEALVADGFEFTFFDGETDPYEGRPFRAMNDLRFNKRMAVYGTYDGYGTEGITRGDLEDNPMLEDTGLQWEDQNGEMRPVMANDLFRAVHDAFGHGLEGAGFRARGEENAWQAHARLFTGPALGAITSETRGQNSWLNYGPYGETNQTASLEDTVFADQKTGLMPEWTWQEGKAPDMLEDTQAENVDDGANLTGTRFSSGRLSKADKAAEDFAQITLVPNDVLRNMLGAYPEYMDGVVQHMTNLRNKWQAGQMKPRDVAKAYWITIASIGSAATKFENAQNYFDTTIPDAFASYNKNGVKMVRPEEFAAFWFTTPIGQRALDAIDQGRVDKDAFDDLVAKRQRAFGRFDMTKPDGRYFPKPLTAGTRQVQGIDPRTNKPKRQNVPITPFGATIPSPNLDGSRPGVMSDIDPTGDLFSESLGRPKEGAYGVRDMYEIAQRINQKPGDKAVLKEELGKLTGIGEFGKLPFISHFFGVGDAITMDARELNFWITGEVDTSRLTEAKKKGTATPEELRKLETLRKFKQNDELKRLLNQEILNRMQELQRQGVIPANLTVDDLGEVGHHWIWDASEGDVTTHEGTYLTMTRFSSGRRRPLQNNPGGRAKKEFGALKALRKLDHFFDHKSDLPEREAYELLTQKARGEMTNYIEIGHELGDIFLKAKENEQAAIYNYLTNPNGNANTIPDRQVRGLVRRGWRKLRNQPSITLRQAAIQAKQDIIGIGEDLVRLGMLDPDAYANRKGKYLPRVYLKYLFSEDHQKILSTGGSLKMSDLGYLKKRKDVDALVRNLVLGEIKSPGYLVSKTLMQSGQDIARMQFLKDLSGNQEWVLPESYINVSYANEIEGILQANPALRQQLLNEGLPPAARQTATRRVTPEYLAAETRRLREQVLPSKKEGSAQKELVRRMIEVLDQKVSQARTNQEYDPENYTQLPDTSRYGDLRGAIVRNEIYDDLVGSQELFTQSGMERGLNYLTSLMKWGLTAANPAVWANNLRSNTAMMHFAGLPFHRSFDYRFRALKQMLTNGSRYQAFKNQGLTLSTFAADELGRMETRLAQSLSSEDKKIIGQPLRYSLPVLTAERLGSLIYNAFGDFYQGMEVMDKLALGMYLEDHGPSLGAPFANNRKMTTEAAMREANKALFDYTDVPDWLRRSRRSLLGAPFLTWTYKAAPYLTKMAGDPKKLLRAATWYGGLYTLMTMREAELDDEEHDAYYNGLQDWLAKRQLFSIPLPQKDENGMVQTEDYTMFAPHAFLMNAAADILPGGRFSALDVAKDLGFASHPLLESTMELIFNKDSFTGQPIYRKTDTSTQMADKIREHYMDNLLPQFIAPNGWTTRMIELSSENPNVFGPSSVLDRQGNPTRTLGQQAQRVVPFMPNVYPSDLRKGLKYGRQDILRSIQALAKEYSTNRRKYRGDREALAELKAKYDAERARLQGLLREFPTVGQLPRFEEYAE